MKLPKLLILLSSIVLLSACVPKPVIIKVTEYKKVSVDPGIMKECGKLVDTLQDNATFEDVLVIKANDAVTYAECKKLNENKGKIIREYLINEKPTK